MANSLPMYVAFQSKSQMWAIKGKYFRYVDETVPSIRNGYIQIGANEVVSPYTKFQIEVAKTHDELIHIKSCYTNKYLATVSSSGPPYNLAAWVDMPNEDRSDWKCTLFQTFFTEAGVDLLHVQRNTFVTHSSQVGATYCLHLSNSGDRTFGVIDWESLSILPDRLVFKGSNDRYASAKVVRGNNHLELSARDIGHNDIGHQAFNTPDGSVRIKSDFFNRFWRRNSGGWILADSTENNSINNTRETLFQPVKVGADAVAFRNLNTRDFATTVSKEGKTDSLTAIAKTIDKKSILNIEEPVWTRSIYNVNFRFSEATIYNQEVIAMVSTEASNASTEEETIELALSYTEEFSRTWNHNISVSSGVETTIKTGIPIIADGTIKVSVSGEYNHAWGKTVTGSKEEETTYTVPVPAGTRVNARVLVMKSSAHIPFSYTQRDQRTSGTPIPVNKTDGIYNCMNSYYLDTESTEEPLETV